MHEVVISPEQKVLLALEVVETTLRKPSQFWQEQLMNLVPATELQSVSVSLKKLETEVASSKSLGIDPKTSTTKLSLIRKSEVDSVFDCIVYLSNDMAGYAIVDSVNLKVEVAGPLVTIHGLGLLLPKASGVQERAVSLFHDRSAKGEIVPKQTNSTTVSAVLSPNLFRKQNIFHHDGNTIGTFSKSSSLTMFGYQIFSRPWAACGFTYKDLALYTEPIHALFISDANWDRIIYCSDRNSDNEDFIRSSLSHGTGSYGCSFPSGIDFMGWKAVVSDAFNNTVKFYSIGTSSGDLIYSGSASGVTFATPIDVAATWILNPAATTGYSGEFSVLNRGNARVDVFNNDGGLKGSISRNSYGPTPLKDPTSIAYTQNLVTGFLTDHIVIADNGNKRVVNRPVWQGLYRNSTPPGLFPDNAYLTSVDCDNTGWITYVVDNANSMIYTLSPDLQEVWGTIGGLGDDNEHFQRPICINNAYGWQADGIGDPLTPLNLGDIYITEDYGATTGIRKYVHGYDVTEHSMTYNPIYSIYRWNDYLEVNWRQTGITKGTVTFWDGGIVANGQVVDGDSLGTVSWPIMMPGDRYKRLYFEHPNYPDTTVPHTFFAEVDLQGYYDPAHTEHFVESIDATRQFNLPLQDSARIEVLDCGIADARSGQRVESIYGYTIYMLSAVPFDTYDTSTVPRLIYKIWGARVDFAVEFSESLSGPWRLSGITTLRDTIYMRLLPTSEYNGQVMEVASVEFKWLDTATSGAGCLGPDSLCVYYPCIDAVRNCLSDGTAPSAEDDYTLLSSSSYVCSYVARWNRPFFCAPPGGACPTGTPTCPFLYARQADGKYEFVNNILPQSEYLSDSVGYRHDWLPIYDFHSMDSLTYDLALAEDEHEVTQLDQIELYTVDIPLPSKQIAMTSGGEVVALQDTAYAPILAVTQSGLNVTNQVNKLDSAYFSVITSGYLDITYSIPSSVGGRPVQATLASSGGTSIPPPDKNFNRISPTASFDPNIYTVLVADSTGNFTPMDTIAARMVPGGQVVELSNFIRNDTLRIRLQWSQSIRIDYLPYLKFANLPVQKQRLGMVSAQHSVSGNATSILDVAGDSSVVLSPGERIDLKFTSTPESDTLRRVLLFHAVGRYESSSASGTSSVADSGFTFHQNYPNPFNPSTSFSFSLPQAGEVSLIVYNVLGQKVATILNEWRPAGTHSVSWNSRDDSGKPIASGVYFATLSSGSLTATRKMVVVK